MKRLDAATIPLGGTQLIEAAAGTGKTHTIGSLFLRLVLTGYPVNEILVVTFTEAATAELRERLRDRLRKALSLLREECKDQALLTPVGGDRDKAVRFLQAALSGFDEASVMTIHGFCRRMLTENAFESGVPFDIELQTDSLPLYEEVAQDFWALAVYEMPAMLVRYLQEKNMSPGVLAALLRRVAGKPDRVLLPAISAEATNPAALDRLYGEARRLWLTCQDEIKSLLTTHAGVNRQSYNKANLKRWLDNVAAYFSGERASTLPGEMDLKKFTRSILAEKAIKLKGTPAPLSHPFFDHCERLCAVADQWLPAFQQRFIEEALLALEKRKKDTSVQFFDDLVFALDRALAGPGGALLSEKIQKRFRAALIDEFQDTDQAQYRIFRRVYQGTGAPFFLIGDPKQSIYAFRGADIFAYLQAVSDAEGAIYSLDTNWRSDPSLVAAVNALFDPERVHRPFGLKEIQFAPAIHRDGAQDELRIDGNPAAAFEFLFIERNENTSDKNGLIPKEWMEAQLPGLVARDISRLVSGNAHLTGRKTPLGPGDVAVLVRTNQQAGRIQAAMRRVGLPCVITSGDNVFDTKEAVEMWRILKAVLNPADDVLISNVLATDLFGLCGNDIAVLRSEDAQWAWWALCFRDWHRLWHESGFIRMIRAVFSLEPPHRSVPLLQGLLQLVDGDRRVTNFQHLSELLHAASSRNRLGPAGLLGWIERQIFGRREAADVNELRLESDAMAVQVVTIHKAKGLQYPVVYAPYLWDSSLYHMSRPPVVCHDPLNTTRTLFDFGSDQLSDHIQLARFEEMAENLRLLYVALTRARHACRVVWGAANSFQQSALGYLLHSIEGDTGLDAIARHMAALNDSQILSDLQRLAIHAKGAISFRPLTSEAACRYERAPYEGQNLVARKARRVFVKHRRIESYSRLVAETAHVSFMEEKTEFDHDQRIGISQTMGMDAADHDTGERILLADFSRGAEAGIFFHTLYEHLDFTTADKHAFTSLVSNQLSAFGFQAPQWLDTVVHALTNTLHCPLDADIMGLSLSRISGANRLNELEFVFPATGYPEREGRITAAGLAAVFTAHAGQCLPSEYITRLSRLQFPAIDGFLKGFMDLVFSYHGKWYLADYKSNYLGDTVGHYGRDALLRAMADHHYFLQYHLYTVALHRYLGTRVPDYDYDTHFGGVYYLFIRGMAPQTGPNIGVYKDRPSKAFITALSNLFWG
ncbi:MAG: exodeoxyribonuclease V subunit beta [Desulfobacterales bacterium]|jgi:exodeoxyribonuclease V beta subunit|nr:exodeoxyribonuclease V subunit beta [Desulfobacterales bacterium]